MGIKIIYFYKKVNEVNQTPFFWNQMFLSGLKSRQVDSVELPSIRCDPLNMRHQDFNIIFQPPNEATSGFVIILCCSFFYFDSYSFGCGHQYDRE